MIKAYIFEVEATNTGHTCIVEIVTAKDEEQIEDYYQWNYDSESYGYQFSSLGLTTTKQTTLRTL